jgi:hypothetical protein
MKSEAIKRTSKGLVAEHIQWSVEMYLESWDGSRFMTFRQE